MPKRDSSTDGGVKKRNVKFTNEKKNALRRRDEVLIRLSMYRYFYNFNFLFFLQLGCYSGGADKTVKLWQFELVEDPTGESKAKVNIFCGFLSGL